MFLKVKVKFKDKMLFLDPDNMKNGMDACWAFGGHISITKIMEDYQRVSNILNFVNLNL